MFDKILQKFGMGDAGLPVPTISPSQANAKMLHEGLVLIDVREPNEWSTDGSPLGSVRIALQAPDFVDQVLLAVEHDKAVSVALCCRSGLRGKKAATLLLNAGFENILNLEGGMVRWVNEKLPVTK